MPPALPFLKVAVNYNWLVHWPCNFCPETVLSRTCIIMIMTSQYYKLCVFTLDFESLGSDLQIQWIIKLPFSHPEICSAVWCCGSDPQWLNCLLTLLIWQTPSHSGRSRGWQLLNMAARWTRQIIKKKMLLPVRNLPKLTITKTQMSKFNRMQHCEWKPVDKLNRDETMKALVGLSLFLMQSL